MSSCSSCAAFLSASVLGFAAYGHAFESGALALAAGAGFFDCRDEFFDAGFLVGVIAFLCDAGLLFFR